MLISLLHNIWSGAGIASTLSIGFVIWAGYKSRKRLLPWVNHVWQRDVKHVQGVSITAGELITLCKGLTANGKRAALASYLHRHVEWHVRIDHMTDDDLEEKWYFHGGHILNDGLESGGVNAHFQHDAWQIVKTLPIGFEIRIQGRIVDVSKSVTLGECQRVSGFLSLRT